MHFFVKRFKAAITLVLLLFTYNNIQAQSRSCPGDDFLDLFAYITCEDAYFPETYLGETQTRNITIRSGNKNPLTISAIPDDPSAIFTFEKPALPITLSYQATITLKVTFQPQEAKDYRVVLRVQSNAYGYDHEIVLSGKGLVPLKPNLIVSGNLDFGRHHVGTKSIPENIILENIGNAPAKLLHAILKDANGNFSFQPDALVNIIIEPQQVEVPVTFIPNEKGFLKAELSFVGDDNSIYTLQLRGAGTSGEILTDVKEIAFPVTELNTPAVTADALIICADGEFAETVVITSLNCGAQAYCDDIDRHSFTLPEIALPLTLYPGQSVRIPVTFKPFSAGEKSAVLNVTSDANSFSLPLTGVGKVNENKILSVENNSATEESVIKYSIAETTDINISVYNIAGELVQSLVNPGSMPGIYESAMNNKSLPSGVYFLNIRSSVFNETRSFVITR
ncbi:MAG: choice-of-anchor D domain-containing protein [Bacteroidota bacterium]